MRAAAPLRTDYWCPSADSLDPAGPDAPGLEWPWDLDDPADEGKWGLCPDHLFPQGDGCEDHYQGVEDLCLRVSAYPLTHGEAAAECQAEGSFLAYVPSQAVQAGLAELIMSKITAYPDIYDIDMEFWAGAHALPDGSGDWAWDGHNRPMAGVYENWRAATPGYGCHDSGCGSGHGMFLRPKSAFDWRAESKQERKAFACTARCQRGYRWYHSVSKCVMVVGTAGGRGEDARTVVEAARECSALSGGRLYSAADCGELEALRDEMLNMKEVEAGQEFFLGSVGLGLEGEAAGRRRSSVDDGEIDAYG